MSEVHRSAQQGVPGRAGSGLESSWVAPPVGVGVFGMETDPGGRSHRPRWPAPGAGPADEDGTGGPSTSVMTVWCRMTMHGGDRSGPGDPVILEGAGRPDLAAVDQLARRMLEAARTGGQLVIEFLDPELSDLVELAGLAGLGTEMPGKAEGREEPPRLERLEEEGQLGDPPP